MPRTIIGDEGGGGVSSSSSTNSISKRNGHNNSSIPSSSSVSASSSSISKQSSNTPKRANVADTIISSKCANTSNDDVDEIKVYEEEGAAEEEQRNSEINLNEDKIGLVNEAEEEKPSILSHPFSVNNLMLYNNGQDHLTSSAVAAAAAAQFGLSRNLYHPLYPSPELAHLASWWPAAASLYNPLSSPHSFPFSSAAFSAANYNAQQAAAAAFSRFNPSFFLPPTSTNGTTNSTSQSDNSQQQPSNLSGHNRSGLNLTLNNNNNGQFNHSSRISSNSDKIPHFNQEHNTRNPNKISHHGGNLPKHSSLNDIEQPPSKPKKPHIKKPLNAFMLFMKEQRSQVVSECTLRESAAINQILGRKWHELDRADQAKYYEMARQERLKHMQLYPGWSARDNYGLKKKRRRKREKIVGENGELPRKCRARYGLHQINLWCKPCRRKKKCIRFTNQDEMAQNVGLQMSNLNQNMGNNLPIGYPGIHLNGVVNSLTNGAFSCGSVGEGSSGGVGSGGSLNGGNSDDDYDQYEDDDDDDEEDCDEDDFNDDSQDSDTENKHLIHSNGNSNVLHGGIMNNMTSINNNRAICNSNIPGLGINGNLNIHDFSVSNLEQKNDILIKPENLL